MVVREGMRPVALGGVIGIAAAWSAAALIKALLFGVDPLDLPTYAGALTALAITAAVACALPALRATRVDPLHALRNAE
jgi:ABC-type antimicrobial peptide transport system permease subunit